MCFFCIEKNVTKFFRHLTIFAKKGYEKTVATCRIYHGWWYWDLRMPLAISSFLISVPYSLSTIP